MKYKLIITKKAEIDVRNIYEYISYTLLVPQIAANIVLKIENAIKSLDTMPNRFRSFDNEPWKSRNVHKMLVGNFVIIYKIEDDIVTVLRVLYGGRDIDKEFN